MRREDALHMSNMKLAALCANGPVAVVEQNQKDPVPLILAAMDGEAPALMEEKPCFEPNLSIKQNAKLLQLAMTPEKAANFDRLLDLSGLKKKGWSHPFRKDMNGEKKLWRILITLLTAPGSVLLPGAMVGMNSAQRECFDAILAALKAEGRGVILSAQTLKEVMQLGSVETVCLVRGEELRPFSREEIEAERAAMGGETAYEELAKRLTEVEHG